MRQATHHKHSSTKAYRRLLDRLADHPDVHRVATGRVTPRMGAGPPDRADLEGPRRSPPGSRSRSTSTARSSTPTSSPTAPTRSPRSWRSRAGRGRERAGLARPRSRAASGAPRARRGHGGTSLPGKVMLRLDPRRDRAPRRRRSPRRQRARLGDQRQDDDDGARGVDLRARRASRPSTTSPARTWRAASPRRCCGAAPARGSACSRSTSSGSPRSPPRSSRARSCSATCSATSSTATASSRRSASAGPRSPPPRPTRLVLNADDPLIADLGRDAPERALLRHRGRRRRDTPAGSRTPPTRRAAAAAAPPTRYAHVYLAHLGVYACPSCGARRARAGGQRHARSRSTGCAARASTLRTPHGARRGRAPRCRASTTSTTRSPRPRSRPRWASTPRPIAAGLGAAAAVFGRGERVRVGERELSILLVKNPAGANEVLRTARRLRTAPHDVLAVLNDEIADGRDVSWIWDADFETLAPRIRRAHLLGDARGRAGAAAASTPACRPERITRRGATSAARSTARSRGAAGATLYALPTYTAMLALRALLARRGQAASSWARA